MTPAFRASVRFGLGAAVSGVCIYLVLQPVDLDQVARHLGAASSPLLVGGVIAIWIDLLLRSLRWQALLRPTADIPLVRVTRYLLVGYLANNVLPARVGELVRAHYVGDRENVSRASVIGTIIVERVLDVMGLVLIGGLAWWLTGLRGSLQPLLLASLAVSILAGGALYGFPVIRKLRAVRRLSERGPRIKRLAGDLAAGLAVVKRWDLVGKASALTLLAWVATAVAFQAASASLSVQLSPAEVLMLAAGVNLATAIPSAPGYVGTFELAAVALAATFGADASSAFAMAVLVHAAILVSTTVGGLVAMYSVGIRWSSLATTARRT